MMETPWESWSTEASSVVIAATPEKWMVELRVHQMGDAHPR
jgi:hypothetical protein